MSRRLNEADALIDATIGRRDESPDAFKAWEEAARKFREARDAMFGPAFDDSPDPHLAAIRAGDPSAVETAIRFLETDPVCFHAGYAKERLLRALKAVPLSATQTSRLRNAMIHSLIEGERKEQEDWCRLAPSLDIERVREALRVLVDDAGDVGRRAAWCLWRIDQYVQMRERLARPSHSDPG
jgi:hypothetical protein